MKFVSLTSKVPPVLLEIKEGRMKNPITRYREEKKLTQVQLSLLLNMSVPSVVLWEGGGVRPSEEATKHLAAIFHIQPEILQKELDEFYKQKREELRQRLGCQAKGRPRTS